MTIKKILSHRCLIHIIIIYYNNIKNKLLELINKVDSKKEETKEKISSSELPELKNNGLDGCCNDTFIKLGGILINKFKMIVNNL
mgnify:CR=1 FL=1